VKKNKLFSKGFTMIEMLVVVIIIALVASIGTSAYRNQQAHVRHTDSIVKVLSMIKQARNYAVSSRSIYDRDLCEGVESYVPEEGYGVYISRSDDAGMSRIVLFANTEADDESEANQYDEIVGAPCVSDLIEEEYFLPGETELIGLSVDKAIPNHTPISYMGGATDDEAVIIFRPPIADTTLAVNNPVPGPLFTLSDLYLQFGRVAADVSISSQYIHINSIAGFPEVEQE
jgi:prepilin-type N-terminal cleavage/methylation domain-containing protein